MPEETRLPIQYRIEIYEDSLVNDPTAVFHSDLPFLSIQPGDYMNHRSWDVAPSADMEGKKMRVKAVEHILWEISGSHIGHSLSVVVEAVPATE